jgi:hypothetical protein
VRPYIEKPLHKNGLVEWLKVQTLSSNLITEKKKKKRIIKQVKKLRVGNGGPCL